MERSAGVARELADDRRTGAVLGIVAYVVWGLLTLYWKQLHRFQAFDLIGWRVISSAVILGAVVTVRRRWQLLATLLRDRRLLARVTITALLLTVNWTSYVWAVVHGRVIETALGYFVAPLGTMLIGVVVFGERLRRVQQAAVVLAVAAIVVLTASYGEVPWLAIAIALSWSLYGWAKKAVPLTAVDGMAAESFVLVVPAIMVVLALSGRVDVVVSSASAGEAALVALSGVATVVPLTMFAYAAPRVPLTVLGPMQYSVPTINFLLGWLVYDEAMPSSRLVGFALVWIGLLATTADSAWRARRTTAAAAAVRPSRAAVSQP